ncbi:MAG: tetratricopeptide repeat protein [Planctomycetes bacterium]|nr:tetratricopeptide repeat protein [Planctomycetota bacterium]MCH9726799.1 tetratricopeptide repeat protein [Planctomycetota bacterium]MCH9775041.1 tetratricopeptide repeat protein [Planctomycetota bacterium]MCH9791419.1 tetratricopeptide repeat protein [Planctomycetota bacterium]
MEFDKALADYNEAIRLVPTEPTTYRNRGALYKQLGQTDKAAAEMSGLSKPPTVTAAAVPRNRRRSNSGCGFMDTFTS